MNHSSSQSFDVVGMKTLSHYQIINDWINSSIFYLFVYIGQSILLLSPIDNKATRRSQLAMALVIDLMYRPPSIQYNKSRAKMFIIIIYYPSAISSLSINICGVLLMWCGYHLFIDFIHLPISTNSQPRLLWSTIA